MANAHWLSKAFAQTFRVVLTTILVITSCPVIALEEKFADGSQPEPLQTEITQQDLKIIEQLVAIAERNSSQVLEAKAGTGLGAFKDVVTLELSPSLTTTNGSDSSKGREDSFSFTVTVDAIKLITSFGQIQVSQARWHETKHQKRLAVMQHYFAYLQARQATKIAAHRMQKFTDSRVANLNSPTTTLSNVNNIANSDYVAAATEMLNTNTRERLALEELAACVGLSSEKVITVLRARD